jgi:hypothetical protein
MVNTMGIEWLAGAVQGTESRTDKTHLSHFCWRGGSSPEALRNLKGELPCRRLQVQDRAHWWLGAS